MGIFDSVFGKKKYIEDEFFGKLQFFDSKDKAKQYFEGNRLFNPINTQIELALEADFLGPSPEQKKFFQQIEIEYELIVEKLKPKIVAEISQWQREFMITDFKKQFIPVHLSIPQLPKSKMPWEMTFEMAQDLNHKLFVRFIDFEPVEIEIDG